MRSIAHWTSRYVFSRAREMLDHRLHPDHPWLTRQSIPLLSELLRPSDIALEFGSGRSTRWFARRVRKITSVEHDEKWYTGGMERLKTDRICNAELIFRPLDVPEEEGASSGYVRVLEDFDGNSLDFCLVDGMYRGACALGAVPKLRVGGLLVIDNSGWFLPSATRTPGAQPLGTSGQDAYWKNFLQVTAGWRRIWTSSGVTDTLLMFKS